MLTSLYQHFVVLYEHLLPTNPSLASDHSIKQEHFQPSTTHTTCSWKGEASYYNIVVDGKVNKDAAWYYPSPKEAAKHITGYVAFWKGVQVDAR